MNGWEIDKDWREHSAAKWELLRSFGLFAYAILSVLVILTAIFRLTDCQLWARIFVGACGGITFLVLVREFFVTKKQRKNKENPCAENQ